MVADGLATQDLDRLSDAVLATQVLELRRLLDRLEGQWLQQLAAVDGRGAAGAEDGLEVGSTAAWLRNRLRLGAGRAASQVRTARALFRGPLAETAAALAEGAISVAHAAVVAHGTYDLPDHLTTEAEPVLVEAARRLDPRQLRRVLGYLVEVADPDGADSRAERRHARRGLWLAPTFEGMVAVDGLLEPEAGQTLLAALEPMARPADATDARSGPQRTADALAELARRALEGGRLPQSGGVRPQLSVIVDLDSPLGHPGAVGGEIGGTGPLDPEACRRQACDGAVTRVLVTRQHPGHHPCHPTSPHLGHPDPGPGATGPPMAHDPSPGQGLDGWLAAGPRPRRAVHRHPTRPATSHRPATSQRRLKPTCKAAPSTLSTRLGLAEAKHSRSPCLVPAWRPTAPTHRARRVNGARPTVPGGRTGPDSGGVRSGAPAECGEGRARPPG